MCSDHAGYQSAPSVEANAISRDLHFVDALCKLREDCKCHSAHIVADHLLLCSKILEFLVLAAADCSTAVRRPLAPVAPHPSIAAVVLDDTNDDCNSRNRLPDSASSSFSARE